MLIKSKIQLKIHVINYRILHGEAPACIGELVQLRSVSPAGLLCCMVPQFTSALLKSVKLLSRWCLCCCNTTPLTWVLQPHHGNVLKCNTYDCIYRLPHGLHMKMCKSDENMTQNMTDGVIS